MSWEQKEVAKELSFVGRAASEAQDKNGKERVEQKQIGRERKRRRQNKKSSEEEENPKKNRTPLDFRNFIFV